LGILGVVFFFAPNLENDWFRTVLGFLIESDSATVSNSILQINRVAVVFVNVNVSAIFWGMTMWLALWMMQRSAGWWRFIYMIFSAIFCIDVLATGSRGGLLALFFTTIMLIIIQILSPVKDHKFIKKALLTIFITISFVGLLEYLELKPCIFLKTIDRSAQMIKLVHNKNTSNSKGLIKGVSKPTMSKPTKAVHNKNTPIRLILWSHALKLVREAPFLGYGVTDFAKLGFPKGYPPHNIFLQVWLYGGILALSGLLLLFGAVFYHSFQLLRLRCHPEMWVPILLLLWVVIQGMFTNLFLCNYRIAMLLWLVISLFLYSNLNKV
jgi:hypothetical protein